MEKDLLFVLHVGCLRGAQYGVRRGGQGYIGEMALLLRASLFLLLDVNSRGVVSFLFL